MEQIDPSSLEKYTASGGKYRHELNAETENGKYIYIYICDSEIENAWKKRSVMPYDGLDYNGQILKFTLFRYMTSKDLRKDKEGVEALTIKDIKNIENGIANYHYTQGIGVESRLMKIIFEYNNYVQTGDPSGHSVMQRVEYWKTASNIIKNSF